MPRARTQLGSAICADTVRVLVVEIQAMPITAKAGKASQGVGASTTTQEKAAWTMVPQRTKASRPKCTRQRGNDSAAKIAPQPTLASIAVYKPGPPACRCLATTGSSAIRPLAWRKNRNTRSSTTRIRGDCQTCCTPTRTAPTKRSPGKVLWCLGARQRRITTDAPAASRAFSTNTDALPRLASSAPASIGPTTRDKFMATPFSASAAGRCGLATISGTIAANTGQRIARPMPLENVSASSSGALSTPANDAAASSIALTETQICVLAKYSRRSRMSASAPLPRPSTNTGKVEAVATSATIAGLSVSEVISQAAATSFIHIVRLAVIQVNQSMRNTGSRSGASAPLSLSAGIRNGMGRTVP